MSERGPLHYHRQRTGQSLQAVGESLGVSRATVWGWERRRRMPDARQVAALAKHFGLSKTKTADLLFWFDEGTTCDG